MRGRDRPISYEKAKTLLLERLAANVGINLAVSSLDWYDGPVLPHSYEFSDESFAKLWARAGYMLDQLVFSWLLPCWVEDAGRWKHATHDMLVAKLTGEGERTDLFVDRDEFEAIAAKNYTEELAGFGSNTPLLESEVKEVTSPRGRPKNSGPYSKSDLPLLEEMAELMKADASLSPTNASLIVAPRAQGTEDVAHRAKRLERKFKAMRKAES